jgi:DNA-binding transcriptional regulator PaaX
MSTIIHRNRLQAAGLIEEVYSIIKQKSGRVTSGDLDKIIGNKQEVRFAITRLTVQGRIKRVRGFGTTGIEYYYRDISSERIGYRVLRKEVPMF